MIKDFSNSLSYYTSFFFLSLFSLTVCSEFLSFIVFGGEHENAGLKVN